MNEESQEEMLARVRAAQKKIQDKVEIKDKVKKKVTPRIYPQRGEVIDEERYKRPKELKQFDQFVKDAAGKKGQARIDGMKKASEAHDKATGKAKEK